MDKILIIGGTNFIGRNLIDSLIKLDKYDLTLFNRGITNSDIYPQIDTILGNRNSNDVYKLTEQDWDYIIDLSCYFPDSLSAILKNTTNKLKRYIFISTCSVYDMDSEKIIFRDENSKILGCDENEKNDNSTKTYGNRKAECERILRSSNVNYIIFRPALVYGKYDNTDRFYYWLNQIKKQDKLLIPNQGKSLFSVTYVKDLVDTIIQGLEIKIDRQVFNVITKPNLSIEKIINTACSQLDIYPKLINCSSSFLKTHDINEWFDIPLWIDNDYFTFDNSKLIRDFELCPRDIKLTIEETIEYYNQLNWPTLKYGISDSKKNELLGLL